MTILQVRKNLEDRLLLVNPLRDKSRVPKVGNPLMKQLVRQLAIT